MSEVASAMLGGVRVADFSWVGAGPHSAKLLSSLGADVVRIESMKRPDVLRGTAGYQFNTEENVNVSAFYGEFNQGKRSIQLNLATEKGRETALEIAKEADVMTESFSPGFVDRIGLNYENIREVNEEIVYLSMPGWAKSGPAKNYRSFGLNLQSMAGLDFITGFPGDPPTTSGQSWPDSVAGVFGAFGMLHGLLQRKHTGKGTYIEVPQYEATVTCLHKPMMRWLMNERHPDRVGNRDEDKRYIQGAYECMGEDRWAVIAIENDSQWDCICNVMNVPEFTDDDRFDSHYMRLHNHDEVDDIIEEWTRKRTPEEVRHRLRDHGVPAGIVANERDLIKYDEQMRTRNYFPIHDHPEVGRQTWGGIPFKMEKSKSRLDSAFPLLGENTEEVLSEWLDVTPEEVETGPEEDILF